MSGKASRNKGSAYERACRKWWTDKGYEVIDPAALGKEGPDVILLDLPILRGEFKNHKAMKLAEWVDQSVEQIPEGNIGFVMHKRKGFGDHEDGIDNHYVTMRAVDFKKLVDLAADKDD